MKIGFITDSYPPNIGGAEISAQKIAEGVAQRNNEVTVITTNAKDDFPFDSKLNANSIIRIKVPNFIQRFWFLFFSFFAILKHCRRTDILHGTSYGGVLQTFIASRIMKKPAVVTIHEFMGKRWNRFAPNLVSAYFFRAAEKIFSLLPFDRFIAVSNYTKKCLIEAGIDERKITVIYNGESDLLIEPLTDKSLIRKELNIGAGKFVFAMYGRTGLTKGFEYVVDALQTLMQKIPEAYFLLILSPGDRNIYRRISRTIKSLNSDRILFYPSLERGKVINYINASDVVIIPSLSEGFGFTTLEACMLKKIVVASSAGSIPEVISGNHILIKPGDKEAIVDGCMMAYEGRYESKEKINFDWNDSVDRYIKIYQDVLN